MAYEMVMPYHLHMPSYFLETFTEYPYRIIRAQITRTFVDTINNIHESPRHLFPDNYSKLRNMLISSAQSVSSGVSSITGISLKRSSFIKRLKKSKPISPLPILS